MMFASPMLNDAALSNYNASYFASAHGGAPTSRTAQAFFSAVSRLRLAFLRRFIGKHQVKVDAILEFGPGPGFFARSWLVDDPGCIYSVVETDRSCHEGLRHMGVHLVDGPGLTTVDLVVMSHVLEHVSTPVDFVRNATQRLRPGGALFIEVPCHDWAHKELDEPHILFFDKPSIRRLLADLGFVDVEVSYYGQKISELKSTSLVRTKLMALRSKLINWGLIAPFARTRPGMESLTDPLERAMVAPYKAHEESAEPAWWLRAVARKA